MINWISKCLFSGEVVPTASCEGDPPPSEVACDLACAADCVVSCWSHWSPCSHSCATKNSEGRQSRKRTVLALPGKGKTWSRGVGRINFRLTKVVTWIAACSENFSRIKSCFTVEVEEVGGVDWDCSRGVKPFLHKWGYETCSNCSITIVKLVPNQNCPLRAISVQGKK